MDNTYQECSDRYIKYIDQHVANVFKAWIEAKPIFLMDKTIDIKYAIDGIVRDLLQHDKSKYLSEEFEPYRRNFFPVSEEEKKNNKESFEMAVQHHYAVNDHHWNHWLNENKQPQEMTDVAIVHMICDWMAMGMQFGNTAAEYYNKNKDNIILAPNTRIKVESILSKMEGKK